MGVIFRRGDAEKRKLAMLARIKQHRHKDARHSTDRCAVGLQADQVLGTLPRPTVVAISRFFVTSRGGAASVAAVARRRGAVPLVHLRGYSESNAFSAVIHLLRAQQGLGIGRDGLSRLMAKLRQLNNEKGNAAEMERQKGVCKQCELPMHCAT